LNDDGTVLVQALDFKGKSLEHVTAALLDKAEQKSLAYGEADIIIASTVVQEKSALSDTTIAEKLRLQVTNHIKQTHPDQVNAYQVEAFAAPQEVRTEAGKSGVSMGKYSVYLNAKSNGVEVTVDDLKKESVHQIIKQHPDNKSAIVQPDKVPTKDAMKKLVEEEKTGELDKRLEEKRKQLTKDNSKVNTINTNSPNADKNDPKNNSPGSGNNNNKDNKNSNNSNNNSNKDNKSNNSNSSNKDNKNSSSNSNNNNSSNNNRDDSTDDNGKDDKKTSTPAKQNPPPPAVQPGNPRTGAENPGTVRSADTKKDDGPNDDTRRDLEAKRAEDLKKQQDDKKKAEDKSKEEDKKQEDSTKKGQDIKTDDRKKEDPNSKKENDQKKESGNKGTSDSKQDNGNNRD
jgi:hypothetical protein